MDIQKSIDRLDIEIEELKTKIDEEHMLCQDITDLEELIDKAIMFGDLCAKRDAKAQAVPEWISVEDKLPKDGDCVLCIHEGGNQHVMMFTQRFKNRISWVKCFLHHDGCGQFQEFYDIGDYCEITHWMPLPDAPQELANDQRRS